MPVEFRTQTVDIPRGSGRRTIDGSVGFGSTILNSGVAINGFSLDYAGGDRNMGAIEVNADRVSNNGSVVNFRVTCNLRDNSGNDEYSGWVTLLAAVEVA